MKNLIDWVARRRGYVRASDLERTEVGSMIMSAMQPFDTPTRPDSVEDFQQTYSQHVWVYAATYAVAMSAAMAPVIVERQVKQDRWEPVEPNHPLRRLIDSPNKDMTTIELIEITMMHAELAGYSCWIAERNQRGMIVQLMPVKPADMRLHISSQGIDYWEYHARGKVKRLESKDVIYYWYTDPLFPWQGASPNDPASRSLRADIYAQDYNEAFFKNYAMPAAILTTEQSGANISPADRQAIRQAWSMLCRGARNAFKTVPLFTSGIKLEQYQVPISEMQFPELRRMNREEILAVRGVPPIMVGILEGNTFANAEMQRRQFWQETMLPKLTKLQNAWTRQLARQFSDDLRIRFDLAGIEPLHENVDARAKRGQILITSGQWTPNEVRSRLWNLEPLPGGDALVQPRQMAAPPQRQKYSKFQREFIYVFTKARTLSELRNMPTAVREIMRYRSDLGKRVADQVRRGVRDVESLYSAEEEHQLLAPIIAGIQARSARDGMRAIQQAIASIRGKEGKDIADAITASGITDERVVEFLSYATNIRTRRILESDRAQLAEILSTAAREGLNVTELTDAIKDAFGLRRFEAERIARTEIVGGYNYGSAEGMRQAGLTRHVWLSARDDKVRATHRIDGETVKIGEPFSNGVIYPAMEGVDVSEIVNCRCTTTPDEKELLEGV